MDEYIKALNVDDAYELPMDTTFDGLLNTSQISTLDFQSVLPRFLAKKRLIPTLEYLEVTSPV